MSIKTYLDMFARLNRANNKIFSEITRRKAPHKPILLLAVIDLIEQGVFSSPVIDVTGDLVELNELFNSYWRRVAPPGHTSSIAFPFARLNSEPFWTLVACDGSTADACRLNITSVNQLRKHACAARIDEGLFALLLDAANRQAFRQVLLEAHFSPEGQQALAEQIAINNEAFDYSQKLYAGARQSMVAETVETENYKPVSRDQGFRRAVVSAYDHRCALCGLRIITPEGHTAVDAAHIVPWHESRNDDIRNGMALCKLCHWAFDKGMLGVAPDYRIIASPQIGVTPNVPGLLQTLPGREILSPPEKCLWPAQEYLAEHRKRFRLHA